MDLLSNVFKIFKKLFILFFYFRNILCWVYLNVLGFSVNYRCTGVLSFYLEGKMSVVGVFYMCFFVQVVGFFFLFFQRRSLVRVLEIYYEVYILQLFFLVLKRVFRSYFFIFYILLEVKLWMFEDQGYMSDWVCLIMLGFRVYGFRYRFLKSMQSVNLILFI